MNFNTDNLIEEAQAFCARLEQDRGYDCVYLRYVQVEKAGGVTAIVDTLDNFQRSLDYTERYHSGYSKEFPYPFDITSVPSREERELHTLMRLNGKTTELADAMQSAFAKRFVQDLVDQRAQMAALIPPRASE